MADFRTAHFVPDPDPGSDPVARKSAAQENFPVASRLVPKHLRPHVMAFYGFVRLADDIADDPLLEPDVKLAQIDALERALVSGTAAAAWLEPALTLRRSLAVAHVSSLHARLVLQAFRRDAGGIRCRTWDDLLLYCLYSANPVGRFLLELHGEGLDAAEASDALCTALQILNHLQDLRSDWVDLGRCYMPTSWFTEAGGDPEHLVEAAATPAVRAVIDRVLDQTDALIRTAEALPGLVRDSGLRLEAAVIVSLARALSHELRRRDPLAERVELGTRGKLLAVLRGVSGGLAAGRRVRRRPDELEAATRGSTFYWPLKFLPPPKRRAMFAIYAFCRVVDDIADEPGPLDGRRAALADWRRRVAGYYAPEREPAGDPLDRALIEAAGRFQLPQAEFEAMVDGMAMDLDGPIRAPDGDTLTLYCRRVAGSVGLLSVRVFGATDGRCDDFAVALGEAMQLTNILRDLAEDAGIGRLYLPREALEEAGVDLTLARHNPAAVLTHPGLPRACEVVALKAQRKFEQARALLRPEDRRQVWPATAMMLLYARTLTRLRQRGWSRLGDRPRLPKAEKVGVALRCALGYPPAR